MSILGVCMYNIRLYVSFRKWGFYAFVFEKGCAGYSWGVVGVLGFALKTQYAGNK